MCVSILSCLVSSAVQYIGRVPCNIHISMGGTEQTRVFVLHLQRKDEADDNLMVVDEEVGAGKV